MSKRGKSLEKLSRGKVRNEHGVEFTANEQKKLKNLVDSVNRKRNRMLKDENFMQFYSLGEKTDISVRERNDMTRKKDRFVYERAGEKFAEQNDFVIRKRSKSLQQFTSKEDYKRYIKTLEKVSSKGYLPKKIHEYKKNHIKAIEDKLGEFSSKVIKEIRKLSTEDYLKYVQSEESANISYVYDPIEQENKSNQMLAGLKRFNKEV